MRPQELKLNNICLTEISEIDITWQHAMQFTSKINSFSTWHCEPIVLELNPSECLLVMRKQLPIRAIRDWVMIMAGDQYQVSALFHDPYPIPDALRFTFNDNETALLFKIMWN